MVMFAFEHIKLGSSSTHGVKSCKTTILLSGESPFSFSIPTLTRVSIDALPVMRPIPGPPTPTTPPTPPPPTPPPPMLPPLPGDSLQSPSPSEREIKDDYFLLMLLFFAKDSVKCEYK
ncbi:hypothetical protein J437_LFUL006025 [Ladona fulva]|uniref:Uncharacterized protein n=1 Tax=Ladona fulva TaxID=123851 RepID=A0A8K0JZP1_LADFU|nr:hypothetical protein J437_LFUL006025 [Ladona fulva]